ncbi:MAG TPA: hypothetical protein PKH91_01340, partial [Flavobacterium sp.]|nr:hypothetical protein [Flavobacterium sp.]
PSLIVIGTICVYFLYSGFELSVNPWSLVQQFVNQTIEQNITSLLVEIKNPTYEIGRRTISFEYILGFINAKNNDFDSAEFWIKKHFDNSGNEVEQNLVLEKFKALKKTAN